MTEEKKKQTPKKSSANTKISKKIKEINMYKKDGSSDGVVDFPIDLIPNNVSDRLLALYVRVYLSHQKPATASTKGRAEVRGSTRKIYKQKGTGRARHGDIRAPIFVGGGVVHGPKPFKRELKMNKKQRRRALLGSVRKIFDERRMVCFNAKDLSGKTAELESVLKKILPKDIGKTLIIYGDKDNETITRASMNSKMCESIYARVCNAYDLMKAGFVLFTKEGKEDFISHFLSKKEPEKKLKQVVA